MFGKNVMQLETILAPYISDPYSYKSTVNAGTWVAYNSKTIL
jgi:hypothetical protein